MMLKSSLIVFITVVVTTFAQGEDIWWHHASIYQIYPRSFKDSNDDGTGDLKGIEQNLDYIKDTGFNAIWLSPIFTSPMKDFGYDISDFVDIDPIFGDLHDFKSLLDAAHERDLKVLLDFVPNHSSDEHEWFKKSVAMEEPYSDYYVWLDPKGIDDSGSPIPPNNWLSVFRGSAWEYNEERGQFYLHQFVAGQPDLNYRNPLVVQEMLNVLSFWLDLGVDGFRMDAVAHIWEDGEFKDEPISGNTDDPMDYGYLNHIYTNNLPQTREILKQFQDLIKSYAAIDGYDRLNMVEFYTNGEGSVPYYNCSDFPFNFNLLFDANSDGSVSADRIKFGIEDWLSHVPEGKKANWVIGNHDQWRVGSRIRAELMDPFNLITMTLPGVSVTYYGEEIGMTNTEITWEDTVDPSGCNCGFDHYADRSCSRDPERTPMQWNGHDHHAGFSTAEKTWLPVNPNYVTVNVETEKLSTFSHLNLFKTLLQVKYSDPAFDVGLVKILTQNNVLAFSRTYNPQFYPTYVTLVNLNQISTTVEFSGEFSEEVNTGYVLLTTLGPNSAFEVGGIADLSKITLGANEGLLIYLYTV